FSLTVALPLARRAADRVRAVGHLHPAADLGQDILAVEQVVDGAPVAELHVGGLAAHQEPGAGHDVGRRDPAGLGLLDPGVEGVERVQDPDVGVHRGGAVAAGRAGDVRVCVDEPGHDDPAGHVVNLGIVGDAYAARGADRHDLPTLHYEDAVLDRRARDGPQAGAP